jgi:hypothetical protein
VTRFLYTRTKKVVDIPDHLADAYEKRRWYQRLPEPERVPKGSVQDVLAWVGDDDDRRTAALVAERDGKQRTTLISALSD